ncbi:MAG: hypothetical protein HOI53_09465, partial [Francisellaceae bacterium]|nr:hypothetical protein [Francisellaceae bacterium]
TARLFAPYAQMLRELYEDALSVHLIQTLLSQEEVPPVEDLTAATASHINTHTIDDVSIETEDLDEHHHSNTRSGSPRP